MLHRCSAMRSHFGSSPRAWGKFLPLWTDRQAASVHPHVRGANRRFRPTSPVHNGSSPRAWGKFSFYPPPIRTERFIPTCVGQINQSSSAHISVPGSSPRAWGKFLVVKRCPFLWRFIPTCVGQIQRDVDFAVFSSVHPHVRGANRHATTLMKSVCGSSPRAWGKYNTGAGFWVDNRFIPTCVGQIRLLKIKPHIFPVHPHVRGANSARSCGTDGSGGSSPRAWGKY